MTATTAAVKEGQPVLNQLAVVATLTGVTYLLVFGQPLGLLLRDWWNDPEAGHGLLLGPVAIWLAWKSGLKQPAGPRPIAGLLVIAASILLRYLAGLAAELFTMRTSALIGAAGLVIYFRGFRQVFAWWLPFTLLLLSIPLPAVITSAITLPLQFQASKAGAALLHWRGIPVELTGNIILVPGRRLFVTEACSGLRSLTALVSLSILLSALWLRTIPSRVTIVLSAVGIAIAVNAVRVFLTGFLVVLVSPAMGEGFMHMTEGWLLFVVSFASIATLTWLLSLVEHRFLPAAPTP